MPKISIIVPVYNVEKYINKCIDSILSQTFKDFELILVDDGSPDKCGEICENYAKSDSRVRVIHKENGGLSDARNAGIRVAKGEYIGLIDSDDYIDRDMYEVLYKAIDENDADISVCGVYDCYSDGRIEKNNMDGKIHVFDNKEAVKQVLHGKILTTFAVNKLYRISVFNEEMFPVGKTYEDSFLIPSLFSRSEKVVLVSEPKYYYLHREDSITTKSFSSKFFDVIEAAEKNLDLVKNKFPSLEKQAMFRYIWANFFVLDKMLMEEKYSDIDGFKEIVCLLKKNRREILTNDCFEKSRKLSIILISLNIRLYRIVVLKKYKGRCV